MARINRNAPVAAVAGRPAVPAVPAVEGKPETFDILGLTVTQARLLRAVLGRVSNPEVVELSRRLRTAVQYEAERGNGRSLGYLNIRDNDGNTFSKDFSWPNIEVVLNER